MKAQRSSMDRISSLPSNLTESILSLLPIKDAAKTSILSRNWSQNWLTVPKLEFIEDHFEVTTEENQLSLLGFEVKTEGGRLSILDHVEVKTDGDQFSDVEEMFDWRRLTKTRNMFYAICQTLSMHRGTINEFTLSMDPNDSSCAAIEHIILYLSRNHTLKKFKLDLAQYYEYDVPLCIFSLDHLTHLYLHNCCLDHHPTKFNGFSSLTSLYIDDVFTTSNSLIHLISNSPLLRSITLIMSDHFLYNNSSIFELFECLRVVESLTLCQMAFEFLAFDRYHRELPALLLHLKFLCIEDVCFNDQYELPLLVTLIRCSPNLEKIKLQSCQLADDVEFETDSVTLHHYSGIWLEHLNEMVIENFSNLKQEMEFVTVILTKSPVLKKLTISHIVDRDEELEILSDLICSSHASPAIDTIVRGGYRLEHELHFILHH